MTDLQALTLKHDGKEVEQLRKCINSLRTDPVPSSPLIWNFPAFIARMFGIKPTYRNIQALAAEIREVEYIHWTSDKSRVGRQVRRAPLSDIGRSGSVLVCHRSEEQMRTDELLLRSVVETRRQILFFPSGSRECPCRAHRPTPTKSEKKLLATICYSILTEYIAQPIKRSKTDRARQSVSGPPFKICYKKWKESKR